MNNEPTLSEEVTRAGGMPSLVEHFSVQGLYGYRSISLRSKFAATILIAKNGSGKTTLLGALDAFLKGQFTRLGGLHFSYIECKLRGIDQTFILNKSDIDEIFKFCSEPDFFSAAKLYEVEPLALLEFIESDYPHLKSQYRELTGNNIFYKIHTKIGYDYAAAREACDKLASRLVGRNANIDQIRAQLKDLLADIDVVYLPTYRRIELSLPEQEDSPGRRKPSIQSRLGILRKGLYTGDIQFGLADISERLARLNQEMLFESNQGYREISANIINDLINGDFERAIPSPEERPSKESLNLFFSRLREGRRMGPYNDIQIPNIDRIYSGDDISAESNKFLTYFLGQLNTVMQKTRDVEGVVEEFIENCNRYLSVQDDSISAYEGERRNQFVDDKILKLDRRNLKVSVQSVSTRRKIPLNSLSSGEKQMISLFARLYLYSGKKIVLIDEPELSLSIDWQRKILVDIINAPSCVQVVAITHSPFVFDNELDEYATSLRLRLDPVVAGSLFPDDEDELNA